MSTLSLENNQNSMHRYYYRFSYFIFCFFIFFISCKSKKTITNVEQTTPTTPTPPKVTIVEDPKTIFLNIVNKNQYTPDFFNAKATISSVMNGNAIDFDAVIQFRKDSAILIVAKKFGFEAGRALITKDSFFIINRLEQEYVARSLATASQRLGLPPRLDLIQDVLMGNVLILSPEKVELNLKDSLALYSTRYENTISNNFLDKNKHLLYQTDIETVNSPDVVVMNYENHKLISNLQFSHKRSVEADSKTNGSLSLDIDFTSIEFNVPKVIRFDIPKRFKKLD